MIIFLNLLKPLDPGIIILLEMAIKSRFASKSWGFGT